MQDAFAKALELWPAQGLPAAPAAWLTTVARRRAVDLLPGAPPGPQHRRATRHGGARAGRRRCRPGRHVGSRRRSPAPGVHLLPPGARPRGAGGADAAHARRPDDAGDRARLPRAGGDHGAAAGAGQAQDPRRRDPVPGAAARRSCPSGSRRCCAVVYLVFNEGYAASAGDALVRRDLCAEAIRLGRLLAELMPDEPEARGPARADAAAGRPPRARIDAGGELVLLEDQDRSRWDRGADRRGPGALLERGAAPGPARAVPAAGGDRRAPCRGASAPRRPTGSRSPLSTRRSAAHAAVARWSS